MQIKYINNVVMNGNLGIHISNDEFKGKGYGTEAEKVIIKYAFEILNLKTLYADTVIRNTRSQHILEKLKFQFITEDKIFKYYKLEKSDY